jgi:hypothetical protein
MTFMQIVPMLLIGVVVSVAYMYVSMRIAKKQKEDQAKRRKAR